ncbi:hypothetical protein TNCV_2452091 [Trichonephila clavipes]|nr:hypothetical protein TNCV_2452091 [Trichonephila clavipes]
MTGYSGLRTLLGRDRSSRKTAASHRKRNARAYKPTAPGRFFVPAAVQRCPLRLIAITAWPVRATERGRNWTAQRNWKPGRLCSDESRFNSCADKFRCRVETAVERPDLASELTVQRFEHRYRQLVWWYGDATACQYTARLPLVSILADTTTAPAESSTIIPQPHDKAAATKLQPGAIFQQDNARPRQRAVPYKICLRQTVLTTPSREAAPIPRFVPIERWTDHSGRPGWLISNEKVN